MNKSGQRDAAELILEELSVAPATMSKLVENTGYSYDTVSKHLRSMRESGLVRIARCLQLPGRGRPQWVFDIGPTLRP